MLEFRVLGPLAVRGANGDVALGGRKQSVLLAVLLRHAGDYVSREALIDALWPDAPPHGAASTIESYISRLRRTLVVAGADRELIQSGSAGYRLMPDGNRIDLQEFERLLEAARAAMARGEVAEAGRQSDAALSMWRGPALGGLSEQGALRADAGAFEERRMEAVEMFAEASVRAGRSGEAIARLSREEIRHPARERLRALLMLALYQEGRQADALEAYQVARRYLVDELGLEPGPALRDLQDRILHHDPSLSPGSEHRPEWHSEPDQAPVPPLARRVPRGRVMAVTVIAGLAAVVVLALVIVLASGSGSGTAAVARTLHSSALGLLDASSGQPRAAIAVGVLPTRLVAGGGADWATSYDNGTLSRIDPRRLFVTQTVTVGHGATGLAVAAGDVWVAASLDGKVTRVDLATDSVVQHVAVGTDPTDLAAGDGAVWVSNTGDGTVSRVDAHTGEVLHTTAVGPDPRGIAVGAGAVWVAVSGANAVVRLDPRTGRLLDRVETGQGPTQVAVGRDGVWVANDLDSTVSLIDPSTDTVTLTREVAGIPSALAPAGDGVWVAASDRPTLTLVQASGTSRQTELPSPPTAIAPTASGVLIGVRGAGGGHHGGTLVVRTSFPIGNVNPEECWNNPCPFTYDGLVGTSKLPGSGGALVPDLALAIPRAQSGGLLYTFRLRPALRYGNGEPVRASDFLRGFERAAAASDISAGYIGALPGACARPQHPRTCDLSKAIIPNDRARTVTFELLRPDPEFLRALALPEFAPAPPGEGITPGTGPYRIAQFVPNRLVAYERNPYFREWSPAAQPAGYPDRIVIRSGASASADVAAVLDGQADYTFDQPTPAQLAQIQLHEPGQLHIQPLPSVDAVFLNSREPPFNDIRVRRALNLAVDRAAIVKLFGGPADATPECQIIPATVAGHEPYCPYTRAPASDGRWTAPDLAKVRSLIAASGTSGETISLLTQSGFPAGAPTGRYIVNMLNQLGFHAHLRLLTPDQFNTAINDSRNPPQTGTFSWIADFPSPSQWIIKSLSCAAWNPPLNFNNHAQFCDRRVDSLAQRAAQLEQTDPVAADQLWAQADRWTTDLAPWVPTVSENEIDLVSRRVGNYQFATGFGAEIDQLWVR